MDVTEPPVCVASSIDAGADVALVIPSVPSEDDQWWCTEVHRIVEERVAPLRELVAAGRRPPRPLPQPGLLAEWGLFLGGRDEATHVEMLRDRGIHAVLNLAAEPHGVAELYGEDFKVLALAAEDEIGYDLLGQHLQLAEEFLEARRCEEMSTLVHCIEGKNRSAAICVAYLMRRERRSLLEAVAIVADARGVVLQNEGFVRQLVALARAENLLIIEHGNSIGT